jgi:hypothetical protein
VAIDEVRVFVILLVIAHHAAMAYRSSAPATVKPMDLTPMDWLAFPVLDADRWVGFDVLVAFNDVFFMSLMFFVSGVVAWPSLVRKGPCRYARGRIVRLGIPFVVSAALLGPLSYYPTFLQSSDPGHGASFARTWLALPHWPSGPVWFLWVLLVFDLMLSALHRAAPHVGLDASRWIGSAGGPAAVFARLVAVSAAAYLPLALWWGPGRWLEVGPLSFQLSRPLLYVVYFLSGVAVGAHGLERGLLAPDGALARRWRRWIAAACGAFLVTLGLLVATTSGRSGAAKRSLLDVALGASFVVSCAASSFAVLAVLVRFTRRARLARSFGDEAYGMFLTHFTFVSWLQYGLLGFALPAVVKGTLVFVGATLLAWIAASTLRRIPAVARVV